MVVLLALLGGACAWLAFGRPTALVAVPSHDSNDGHCEAPGSDATTADIAVIVPARNEAQSLPTLLRSIASSTVTPVEIIVVDDSSTDETAVVARRHGATVISAPPLPTGWLGKPWACHLGAERATAAQLLFLDADVALAPTAIAALVARAEIVGGGLLSVQPNHRPLRPYEQLSAVFNVVGPMGTGAFALRRARPVRTAFGPCLLTSAADYAVAGGHRAVKHEVVEDLALAAHYDDADRPVTVLLGGELVTFRMYPGGLRSLIEGWTKNIAAGATRSHRPSSIAAALWVAALSAIAVSAVLSVGEWRRGGSVPWLDLATWCIAALQVHLLLRRVGRFHPLTSLMFAVPVAFFVAVFIRSLLLLLLRRPVQWRGRDIRSPARSGE